MGLTLGSLLQLIFPFLTQAIVDVGIATKNINFIYVVLAGQLALFISRVTVDFIRGWILLHLSARINISIISDFLVKLIKLPIGFFDGKVMGDVMQRIDDHTRVERFLNSSSLSILFSMFNLLVFGGVLYHYSVQVFIVFSAFSVAYVAYILLFLKMRRRLDYKKFSRMAENQNSLIEIVNGMPEIKLNNCETKKRWEWERIQAKIFKLNISTVKILQIQEVGGLFINELKNILITFLTALSVIQGELTLGMMLAIQYIIGQLNSPINEFIVFSREWQDAKLSLERIQEIQNLKEEDSYTKSTNENLSGKVELDDITIDKVSFSYDGRGSEPVLEDISFTVPKGRVTAIVGMSGSGKTTLVKLLLKFYSPTAGRISVGNENLKSIPSMQWRQLCGVVMQDGYIFADTIANNIALSSEFVDTDRLEHATTVANLKAFIESLPLGYGSRIGSNGIGLSQGQKQRLLIARAVYKNPQFILFDEATSSLDANNERSIMKNLDEFVKGRTVLIIAHRLSTVKNADQIILIEKGRVMERGHHQHLLTKKGNYFELVKNQLELG